MKLLVNSMNNDLTAPWQIFDEAGNAVLDVRPTEQADSVALELIDQDGKHISRLSCRLSAWKPFVDVTVRSKLVGRVVRRFDLQGSSFQFDGINWHTEGDADSYDFGIFNHEYKVAEVALQAFEETDCIQLDVANKRNLLPAICMLLTVELIMIAEQRKTS